MVFTFGCIFHFNRGYYSTPPPTGHARGNDDAYISYRYGWNLTHFKVLAWNESGFRRLEGFTNPLWVYVSALASLTNNKNYIYPLMTILSVILCASLLTFILSVCDTSIIGLTGFFLVACSPVVWLHTTSGLESGVFGFLIGTLAWLSINEVQRYNGVTFMLVILAVLFRSDGFVYVLPIVLAAFLVGKHKWKVFALALIIAIIILLAWRLVCYHSLFPNTATAKLNFTFVDRASVGKRILTQVLVMSGIGVITLLGATGLALNENRRVFYAGLLIMCSWMGYFIYIGGDHFYERHLIGLFVFSAAVSIPVWVKLKGLPAIVLGLGAFLFIFAPVVVRLDPRFTYLEPKKADEWIKIGTSMAQERPKYGICLCGAAGKIPFFAGGNFVDVVGLNDPELARIPAAKFWPGHSSGSFDEALKIAKNASDVVTYYADSAKTQRDSALIWFDGENSKSAIFKTSK